MSTRAARRPGSLRRRGAAALLAAAVVALGACGVPENDGPHAIARDQVPPELLDPQPSTSTSAPSPAVQDVTVYYLIQQEGVARLAGSVRQVSDATRARDRLQAVLTPPTPDETQTGFRTAIPTDTRLLNVERTGEGELTIDLSRDLFDIQGKELSNAFAQLVWTATELPDVQRVRFRVDGEEVRPPDADGTEQEGAVARSDYVALAPG